MDSTDRDWVLEHPLEAHQGLMDLSLQTLFDNNGKHDKLDVLEWIFAPDYSERIARTQTGVKALVTQHASDIPFSFLNCCRSLGITDPDSFREMLIDQCDGELRKRLKAYLLSRISRT